MNSEQLKEVLSDEAFVKELLDMEEPEQVQKALEDKGVSISTQEIQQIAEVLRKVQSGEISQGKLETMANGELSEEDLEEVAGGVVLEIVCGLVALFMVGFAPAHIFSRGRW